MEEGLYFEDYAPDWRHESAAVAVTDEGIARFVELHRFHTPTFTDRAYVESSKDYGARMAPGLHVLCLAEGAVLQAGLTRRRGIFLMELTPKFLKPVFAGDAITVRVRLKSKRATSKPDRGVVITSHEVVNGRGEAVLSYDSTRMIRTRQYIES
ncbi:MAG: MaoC/PaaZ C-terminal domain-containing protein [Rubrivivax sp.]